MAPQAGDAIMPPLLPQQALGDSGTSADRPSQVGKRASGCPHPNELRRGCVMVLREAVITDEGSGARLPAPTHQVANNCSTPPNVCTRCPS
jgi:hypothetical protein